MLQPVAHMLLHAREDAGRALEGLTPDRIWRRPGSSASVGYHVRHLIGALDRLLTYAAGAALDERQMAYLAAESSPGDPPADGAILDAELDAAITRAIDTLRALNEDALLEARAVGRRRIPTTVIGLIVHAAEHSARHAGQALTVAHVVAVD